MHAAFIYGLWFKIKKKKSKNISDVPLMACHSYIIMFLRIFEIIMILSSAYALFVFVCIFPLVDLTCALLWPFSSPVIHWLVIYWHQRVILKGFTCCIWLGFSIYWHEHCGFSCKAQLHSTTGNLALKSNEKGEPEGDLCSIDRKKGMVKDMSSINHDWCITFYICLTPK